MLVLIILTIKKSLLRYIRGLSLSPIATNFNQDTGQEHAGMTFLWIVYFKEVYLSYR